MSPCVVDLGRESCEQDACDDESDTVTQISEDQTSPSTEAVNEHHTEELGYQCNDRIDCLVTQRFVSLDSDLLIDCHGIVPAESEDF